MLMRKIIIFLLFSTILNISNICFSRNNIAQLDSDTVESQVLLIYDSSYSNYIDPLNHIKQYLDHFGIPFNEYDLSSASKVQFESYSLLLFSHEGIMNNITSEKKKIVRNMINYSLNTGVGIVSFSSDILDDELTISKAGVMKSFSFIDTTHFITQNHSTTDSLLLIKALNDKFQKHKDSNTLINANGIDLLSYLKKDKSRVVFWSTYKWMKDIYLGPLRGLDDCFLRSMIWSAKKPFFVRGIFPIVTMRVDDVYGSLGLDWVKVANKYNFKPWLGLFPLLMSQYSINNLINLTQKGLCTSNAHAFRSDEFIYFNWKSDIPFDENTIALNLSKVDDWYKKYPLLTKSTFLVPHFYEMGSNALDHVLNKWGVKYLGIIMSPNSNYKTGVKYTLKPFDYDRSQYTYSDNNSFVYSDYCFSGNNKFFNGLTEIREWGYDWSPDNDVKSTADRGINIISRSLQSMNIAMLMTHESYHIAHVSINNWESALKIISQSINNKYNPIYLTIDSAMTIVESTHNSKINNIANAKGYYQIRFVGNTTAPTSLYIYSGVDETITQKIVNVPVFSNEYNFTYNESEQSDQIFSNVIGGKPNSNVESMDPMNVISDSFNYEQLNPLLQCPSQVETYLFSENLFTTAANESESYWQANLKIPQDYYLDGIDIWGGNDKSDLAGATDLVLTLSDSVNVWKTNASTNVNNSKQTNYSWISLLHEGAPLDMLKTAKCLRINHSIGNKNKLCLAEIRPILKLSSTLNNNIDSRYSMNCKIIVSPNPIVADYFSITIPSEFGLCTINIFNSFGRLIYTRITNSSLELNRNILTKAGLYLVEAKNEKFKSVVKVNCL